MSNALALAAVTAVVKDLLNNGVVQHDLGSAVGAVTVSSLPPDRIQTGNDEDNRLNLFLYHVSPNPGWRNRGLPSRGSNGERISNPPLALDLHYLLTAYGASEFHTDILLGYGMQILHEHPVLGREEIRTALATPSPIDGGILPPAFQALSAAELAEQPELIKLSPRSLSNDDMSKLWTALQASYRPTAVYEASVVLVESHRPARSALPVLTRGEFDPVLGRDEGVVVRTGLLPLLPTLETVELPDRQPAIRMGETITLRGHQLIGDSVAVRFAHPRSGSVFEVTGTVDETGRELQATLPDASAADEWRAGVYGVSVVVRNPGEPDLLSNELAVAVAPRLDAIAASESGGTITFTPTVVPPVWQRQTARLVVGRREVAAEPIPPGPGDTEGSSSNPDFEEDAPRFESGEDEWVRLRVDGVESLLVDRAADPPAFDPSQRVTIP